MSSDVTVFDLAAARAGALQSLTQETPAAEAAPAPESPVAPAPPQEAQPAATEPEAPVAATPPLPLSQVEIKHRGKTVVIDDPEDLKALAQKGYDYTAKTTELADAKRQLEAREQAWLQREQQVVEFLADKSRVAAYLQQSTGQAQAPPPPPPGQSPDDLLTVGQVQQLLAQQEQRLSQAVQQETSRVREQMPQVAELVQVRQAWAQDVDQHLAGLQKKYPELQAMDDYPTAMKTRMRDYLQANPGQVSNLETAKAIIHDWSKTQAQKIRGLIDSQTKSTLARQAQTAKQPAILPPGGATTTQSGVDTTGLKVGDPRLTAIVAAALQGARG